MSADEMTLITHPRAIARERVDAEVIARSLREPEAFAEIFDRHAADLYRYIRRRLGDGVSDDVLAETFTVAFARRRRYDLARPDARPWLYGIATRLVSGHRRTESRRLSALSRTPVPDGTEPMADRVAEELTRPRRTAGVARSTRRVARPAARRRAPARLGGARLPGDRRSPARARRHGAITSAPGPRGAATRAVAERFGGNASGAAGSEEAVPGLLMALRGWRVMPPDLRGAIFGALAASPEIRVRDRVTDALGRPGIGIAAPGVRGSQYAVIVHPSTFEYIGMRDLRRPGGKVPYQRFALVDAGVVDELGERPGAAAGSGPEANPRR